MTMLGSLDLVRDTVERTKQSIRRSAACALIGFAGLVFFACAFGFAVAALYMWLAAEVPAYQAALLVAVGLLLLGLLVISIAAARNRRARPPVQASSEADAMNQAERAAHQAVDAVSHRIGQTPGSAMLAALALGVVVGILRPGSDKS